MRSTEKKPIRFFKFRFNTSEMRFLRISNSAGNKMVTLSVAATAGCVAYVWYRQSVLGDPFQVIRDAEGVLRYRTRLDVLRENDALAKKALAADPTSRKKQFDAWLADKQLIEEMERLVAAHGQQSVRPLRDEDLS